MKRSILKRMRKGKKEVIMRKRKKEVIMTPVMSAVQVMTTPMN